MRDSIVSIIARDLPQVEQQFLPNRNAYRVARIFGDLKVRPKLMVLHNLFFLVLACAAYFTLIPLFEKQLANAHEREMQIRERVALQTETAGGDAINLSLPEHTYDQELRRAKLTLFLVLGSIYILAVLLLESVIMPEYVYQPLQKMLDADAATQAGDRERELIPEDDILGDEIGYLMRSRNKSIAALRRQEDELANALRKLEEQDRLVSLGLLSASVAHELNTPLAVLNGSIEKLIETSADAHTLDRLARMQRVTQRLRRISESLVDFARVRKQNMEPLAARPLIDEAWSLVAIDEKASAVGRCSTVWRGGAGAWATPTGLRGGIRESAAQCVECCGCRAWEDRRALAPCGRARAESGIAVSVEDNGPGIRPTICYRIFSTRLSRQGWMPEERAWG